MPDYPLPFGAVLSIMVGILLLLSEAGGRHDRQPGTKHLAASRRQTDGRGLSGYLFNSNPLTGMPALPVNLAVLFAFGGIGRLIAGYLYRGQPGSWLQVVIDVLNLIIVWMLVGLGLKVQSPW